MDKAMKDAHRPHSHAPIGKPTRTGIRLKVTNIDTGKEVNYGVQLNNTTLEIEALPNLKVEILSKSETK